MDAKRHPQALKGIHGEEDIDDQRHAAAQLPVLVARESRWRCCSPEESSRGAVPFQEANRSRLAKRWMSPVSAKSLAALEGPMPFKSMSVEPRGEFRGDVENGFPDMDQAMREVAADSAGSERPARRPEAGAALEAERP